MLHLLGHSVGLRKAWVWDVQKDKAAIMHRQCELKLGTGVTILRAPVGGIG